MILFFDFRAQRNRIAVEPGEMYVTDSDETISTVLGSCVSVCLMDKEAKVFGMNHYILPKRTQNGVFAAIEQKGRFGEEALLMLLAQMERKGAKANRLAAEIYGGSTSINPDCKKNCVSAENIAVARKFLAEKNIRILFEDVGGATGRRIYFHTFDAKVSVERLRRSSTPAPSSVSTEKNSRRVKGVCVSPSLSSRPESMQRMQSDPYSRESRRADRPRH